MKRLRGMGLGRLCSEDGRFECDEIVLELDHGRTVAIRRETVGGEDGITLRADITREDRTANARFVIRAPNFGFVHLNVEQAK
jgi:hypothetical protein